MSEEFVDGVTAPEETQSQEQPVNDQEQDYLAEFVGEGKKYSTVEDAAKALAKKAVNSDQFIETLKSEKEELRRQYEESLTRSRTVEDILSAMQEKPVVEEPMQQDSKGPVSIDEVLAEIERRNQERVAKETKQKALADAWDKMSETFGGLDQAKIVVKDYIGNNEARKVLVNTMAVADPEGLVRLLNAKKQDTTFMDDMPSKTIDTTSAPTGKLTWDIARQVKKDNPKLYNSRAFQQRMHTELN